MKQQDLLQIPIETLSILPHLTDTQAGKLFKAIYVYRTENKEEELDQSLSLIFLQLQRTMDQMKIQQQHISSVRSIAGRKGGIRSKNAVAAEPAQQPTQLTLDSDYNSYIEYLAKECKYLYKHMQLPTMEQFQQLKDRWPLTHIQKVSRSLENDKVYRSKYTYLFDTLQEWCTRQKVDEGPQQAPEPQPEQPDVTVKTDEETAKQKYIQMLKASAAKGNQRAIAELKKYVTTT